MIKNILKILSLLCVLLVVSVYAQQNEYADGQFGRETAVQNKVWSESRNTWVSPLSFWEEYARRRGGLTWGFNSSYPRYSDVKEMDTIIIQTKKGPCLMEFFHSRWRRANDVRRWDKKFNQFGGCAYVFEQ